MTVPNKGHARLRGIKTSRKRKSGYIRFTRMEESWSPQFPEIHLSSTIFKVLLLIAIAMPVSLVPAYGYYSNIYLPSLSTQYDPYTTLWNGQSKLPSSGGSAPTVKGQAFNNCPSAPASCAVTYTVVASTDELVVAYQTNGNICLPSVTDTFSNTYSSVFSDAGGADIKLGILHGKTASTGSDTVTVTCTNGAGAILGTMVTEYSTIGGIGNFNTPTETGHAGTFTDTVSLTTGAGSAVFEGLLSNEHGAATSCSTDTFSAQNGQSQIQATCVTSSQFYFMNEWNSAPASGANSFGIQVVCTACNIVHAGVELFSGSGGSCPASYICDSAGLRSRGVGDNGASIQLSPNSTVPGVALSSSAIDLSNGAAKALAFSFVETLPSAGSYIVGQRTAWFLTSNGTLPLRTNYDPLNDSSVVMVVYQFLNTSNTANYYVYLQRQLGQNLWMGSTNPHPSATNCNFGSTLFICMNVGVPVNTNTNAQDPVLNFTGSAANNNVNLGQSYLCSGSINFGTHTCLIGGYQSSQISFQAQVQNQTLFPWLNLQNSYHVGFWDSAGGNKVDYQISIGSNAPIISVFITPTSTTNPNQDTGGFFGWLRRGFVQNTCVTLQAVTFFLLNPCQQLSNVPGDFLTAVVSGGLTVIGLLIAGAVATVNYALTFLRLVLNAFGTFAGWGAIGDQFFSFMSGVITYFTTGLGDALGWLLRLILRSIDLIKTANFWVTFYLNGLLNFMADALNLISEVVTFATKITTFIGSSYAFLIILFFLWYTADMGLAGAHAWFETMKWLAFISFDFLERMINFGISSITWLFGRIPTLDGTTLPELPTIAIGGGPIWPSTDMTALREGNFFAYFAQMIGVAFLIFFETSGLPGSIGSNVTGTAAGNMAPFVTIFLILISVTSLLFVLNIPAKMARQAFGLDDLKPTSLSKFSTGPIATGGVSGHFVRRHVDRKAKIVINRGLGVGGLRPHLRRPKPDLLQVQAKA